MRAAMKMPQKLKQSQLYSDIIDYLGPFYSKKNLKDRQNTETTRLPIFIESLFVGFLTEDLFYFL